MTSSVRSSPEHRFWRDPVAGAALAIATLAIAIPDLATADAMDDCSGAPTERTACLESLEREAAAELAATFQAAVDLYAALDAITGNQRASRTLGQGQAAFQLYRDLDCHLVELQVGAGTDSADHRLACRIDHDRQRTATLASRLPEPPAGAVGPDAAQAADTSDSATIGSGETSTAAAPLILETAWRVVEIAGEPVADGVSPTLAIDAESGISGSGGCNRYFGNAEIDGERITMGEIGATRMACPEPAMGEEQRYLKALDAVDSWRLEADELMLADDEGTVLVRLERDTG
jgi:putative lipoprotein